MKLMIPDADNMTRREMMAFMRRCEAMVRRYGDDPVYWSGRLMATPEGHPEYRYVFAITGPMLLPPDEEELAKGNATVRAVLEDR